MGRSLDRRRSLRSWPPSASPRQPSAKRSPGWRGKVGWSLGERETAPSIRVTERGRRRIEELSPRIYGPVIEWDGRWRLLSYAIGEAHRQAPRAAAQGAQRARLGCRSHRRRGYRPADTLVAARDAAERLAPSMPSISSRSEYRGPLQRSRAARALLGLRRDRLGVSRVYRSVRPRLRRER